LHAANFLTLALDPIVTLEEPVDAVVTTGFPPDSLAVTTNTLLLSWLT
jgi:hypothetical protein